MSTIKMQSHDEDLSIIVEASSEHIVSTLANSHLLTAVLVNLIENMDVGLWEKHQEEVQPDQFWADILRAVATSYYVSLPVKPEVDAHSADFLHRMIDDLKNSGHIE